MRDNIWIYGTEGLNFRKFDDILCKCPCESCYKILIPPHKMTQWSQTLSARQWSVQTQKPTRAGQSFCCEHIHPMERLPLLEWFQSHMSVLCGRMWIESNFYTDIYTKYNAIFYIPDLQCHRSICCLSYSVNYFWITLKSLEQLLLQNSVFPMMKHMENILLEIRISPDQVSAPPP